MNEPLQDKPVGSIRFGNQLPMEDPVIQSNLGMRGQMRYHEQNHGDHESAWVIETDADGKETARHNVRYLESIVWQQ